MKRNNDTIKSAKGRQGFAALLTIVVVSAAALIIAFSSSMLGIGELDLGYTTSGSGEAFSIADGCMEEALERLRKNTSYSGGYLSQSNGSCIITVLSSGGISTTTVVASTTLNYFKSLKAVTDTSGGVISVNSWEEEEN